MTWVVLAKFLTDFHAIVAEPKPRKDHLSHTKFRTECRVEADGEHAEEVEEKDSQERIHEAECEYRHC